MIELISALKENFPDMTIVVEGNEIRCILPPKKPKAEIVGEIGCFYGFEIISKTSKK